MVSNEWMQDSTLKDISQDKLDFLQKLAFESSGLSQQEKMPFFMALANKAKQSNISFSSDEMDRIIAVLKLNSSSAELSKIEQVLKIYRQKK